MQDISHSDEFHKLFWEIERAIQAVSNTAYSADLRKLYAAASNTYRDLDIELINCRRLHRYTAKYRELEERCQTELRMVSKYAMQALLMQD